MVCFTGALPASLLSALSPCLSFASLPQTPTSVQQYAGPVYFPVSRARRKGPAQGNRALASRTRRCDLRARVALRCVVGRLRIRDGGVEASGISRRHHHQHALCQRRPAVLGILAPSERRSETRAQALRRSLHQVLRCVKHACVHKRRCVNHHLWRVKLACMLVLAECLR